MNTNELITLLDRSLSAENLQPVVQLCVSRINKSKKCDISVGDFKLSADHFFRIYAGRMKNKNGVAAQTPGLPESVQSLKMVEGLVKMVTAELDDDAIAIWLSLGEEIVGCIKFLSKAEALEIAERSKK